MASQKNTEEFLSSYGEEVVTHALMLRELLLAHLPSIAEKVDVSARMIAYCYGQKYSDLICVIIPSTKGLKLGFNRGVELADPSKLLEGSGKISRYVVINSTKQIQSAALKKLIKGAVSLYRQKISKA